MKENYITTENYEVYFIDYLDGQLTEQDKKALESFLASHPDKKLEFEEFISSGSLIDATANEVVFKKKESLVKTFNDLHEIKKENFDEVYIAYKEGDLPLRQTQLLNNFIKTDEQGRQSKSLLDKTFLVADQTIKFKKKNLLYKGFKARKTIYKVFYATISAAAAILIGLVLWVQQPVESNLAQIELTSKQDNSASNIFEGKEENTSIKSDKDLPIKPLPGTIEQTTLIAANEIPLDQVHHEPIETIEKLKPLMLSEIETTENGYITGIVATGNSQKATVKTSKHYLSLGEYLLAQVNKTIPEELTAIREERNVLAYLESGVNELSEKVILKKYNAEGEVKSIAFETPWFGFYTTKSKK